MKFIYINSEYVEILKIHDKTLNILYHINILSSIENI